MWKVWKQKRKDICRKLAGLCLMAGALCLLGACKGVEKKSAGSADQADKPIRIGMSFDSFVIERWQRDRDVFVSVAKELGAEVNVQSANGEIEQQEKQIQYFIDQGMDVIVIICIDSQSLKESVKKAKAAGIKVIAYDRLIMNADVDLYISFDNEMVGTMMGQALIENGLAGKKVLMLGGPLQDNNVPLVESAFRSVMDAYNVEILDSFHAEGWRAEEAAEYIYRNPRMAEQADAVMCGNDNLASSVVRALAESRLAGTIPVTGQDADLEACQRIVEGTQIMTVYKPVERLAKQAAECAIYLAKGQNLSDALGLEQVSSIDDGTYYVPFVKLAPISVTKENIDEVIIGSGFHMKEDVYLNVPDEMKKEKKK